MKAVNEVKCFLLCSILGAFLHSSALEGLANPQDSPLPSTPEAVVEMFLKAWINADLETLYALLDQQTQARVSLEELRSAFIYSIPSDAHRVVAILLLADSKQPFILRGRPAEVWGVRIAQKNETEALVDACARFTFASRTGIDPGKLFLFFLGDENPLLSFVPEPDRTKITKQIRVEQQEEQETGGLLLLAWGMALPRMLEGEVVNTAKNQEELFTGYCGDKQISLHFHRYTLICENGQWKITNAITVGQSRVPFSEKRDSSLRSWWDLVDAALFKTVSLCKPDCSR